MTMVAERTLGQKIRRAREHKGWTQTVLAEELGVSLMAVSAWETDTRLPRVSVRPKVWSVLGLAPSDFDNDPPPTGAGSLTPDGGRELNPGTQPRQPNDEETVAALFSLMGIVLNTVESVVSAAEKVHDALSPAEQLDVAKELSMVRRKLEEKGQHDLAEKLRVVLTKQEYRAGRILVPLITALALYFVNGGRDAARQAVEDEFSALKLKSA